jgi:hypothetical protein
MAYGGIKRLQAAELMDTTPGTLDRILGTKGSETKTATWDQLMKLAAAVDLPPEWFSADLNRLPEIVPAGSAIFVRPADGGAPPIPGATGRRLQGGSPTRSDHQRPGSDPDTGSHQGGAG